MGRGVELGLTDLVIYLLGPTRWLKATPRLTLTANHSSSTNLLASPRILGIILNRVIVIYGQIPRPKSIHRLVSF